MRLALAIGMLLVASAPSMAWEQTEMNRQIDQTNFLVNNSCSGTLVDKENRYILTANHCVADQFMDVKREEVDEHGKVHEVTVRVKKPGTVTQVVFDGPAEILRTTYVYRIKDNDPTTDLALVQVVGRLPNALETHTACKEPVRGDTEYAVGNPHVVMYASVTKGIVASVQRTYGPLGIDAQDGAGQPGDHALMQVTSPVAGGNSGGAVYNDNGAQIGVVVRRAAADAAFAFAVPLKDLKEFLKRNEVAVPCK